MKANKREAQEERICDICGTIILLHERYYEQNGYDCCSGVCLKKARIMSIRNEGKNLTQRLLEEKKRGW